MDINSEAIYGAEAISPYKDRNVCLTKKGDNILYVYYLAREGELMPGKIEMSNFSLPEGSKVEMLGVKGQLSWSNEGSGFIINIPEKHRKTPPSDLAWVIKVRGGN